MVKPAIELYDKYAKWVDLGTIATAYATSSALPPYYEKNPYSVEVFLRIIPPRMKINMGGMNMNTQMKI